MKKIYKAPKVKVVKMVPVAILVGSPGVYDEIGEDQMSKGFYPDFEEEEEMDGYGW